MPPSIDNAAAAGMEKSGADFYAFLAIVLILGIVALVLWFRLQQAKQGAEKEPKQPQQDVQCTSQIDKASLLAALSPILLELQKLSTKFEILETTVEANQEREEGRLAELDRKMEDGFRGVHSRIDIHLQAHGRPS